MSEVIQTAELIDILHANAQPKSEHYERSIRMAEALIETALVRQPQPPAEAIVGLSGEAVAKLEVARQAALSTPRSHEIDLRHSRVAQMFQQYGRLTGLHEFLGPSMSLPIYQSLLIVGQSQPPAKLATYYSRFTK